MERSEGKNEQVHLSPLEKELIETIHRIAISRKLDSNYLTRLLTTKILLTNFADDEPDNLSTLSIAARLLAEKSDALSVPIGNLKKRLSELFQSFLILF